MSVADDDPSPPDSDGVRKFARRVTEFGFTPLSGVA